MAHLSHTPGSFVPGVWLCLKGLLHLLKSLQLHFKFAGFEKNYCKLKNSMLEYSMFET